MLCESKTIVLDESSCERILVADKYEIMKVIGKGSFGICYLGYDIESNERVAIKFERKNIKTSKLELETKFYNSYLNDVPGIPKIYWFGALKDSNVLVLELLGKDLESLFNKCSRTFSTKTVLLLAIKMLLRIKSIHEKGIIHRDIKPENFLIGTGSNSKEIYLIDFGLSKLFMDKADNHIAYCEKKCLTGTARYCSISTHKGIEQSRRDDLETLGYVLIYFLKGSLPWQNIKAKSKKQRYKLICEKKIKTSLNDLCRGLPLIFHNFLFYSRSLTFTQAPAYVPWLKQFEDEFIKITGRQLDYEYDWDIGKVADDLAHLTIA